MRGKQIRKKQSHSGKNQSNRGILVLTYGFVFLFIAMIGYLVYFVGIQAETVIGNPYNARLNATSDRITRGSILSSDGTVLARTELNEKGEEVRVYPYGALFAHSVGYSSKGKTGLEAAGNFYLLRSHINLIEQVVDEFEGDKSPGDNLVTTLRLDLQQAADKALGDRRGAVVAMDVKTGNILAMVSKPGFDPNTIAQDWENLVSAENQSGQLLNRATQGLYPPGSTFKMITTLAYIRQSPQAWMSFQYDCNGEYRNGEYVIHCFDNEVHGLQTLQQAFANSCNAAFAEIGTGLYDLRETTDELLFNQDLPMTITSSKSQFSMEDEDGIWMKMQTAIGQGETLMTPIHNLLITAAVANDGIVMKPNIIHEVQTAAGQVIKTFKPQEYKILMTEAEAAELKKMMRSVVTDGTASVFREASYEMAGKTGSAEYQEDGKKKTHAWFTGFAPAAAPEVAITVIVEDGKTGGRTAAPVAKAVTDVYFGA